MASILNELMGKGADPIIRAARKSFWAFCRYMNPKFFKRNRPYLKELADTLQALYERKLINAKTGEPYVNLMINVPPRHGKSYILSMFNMWVFGQNQAEKIITVSYNETLSTRFAKTVRNGIDAKKTMPNDRVYNDVFPGVAIQRGDGAMNLWSLEGQYASFLASSFGGTLTGFGSTIFIVDDPVKSDLEAANEELLDSQWKWYRDTSLSRVESIDDEGEETEIYDGDFDEAYEDDEEGDSGSTGLTVVVMTRWSTKDLCGRLLEAEPDEWYVFERAACVDEKRHKMLCPGILNWRKYTRLMRLMSKEILDANYGQQPIDVQGRLYGELKTYNDIPRDANKRALFEKIISYTDTADTGADYLCTIVSGLYQGQLYVLDVQYTDKGMEITEPETCDMLYRHAVQDAYIESNNGGRGFARNVERLLWERHRWRGTKIIPRMQRQNKEARIIVGAAWIMLNVHFPDGWMRCWREFARDLMGYQRKGRNKHDDAPDTLTGLAEMVESAIGGRTKFASGRGRRYR